MGHAKRFVVVSLVMLAVSTAFAAGPAAPSSAYTSYLKALLLESQNNFTGAREELDKALNLSPENGYLYRTASELSLRLGQINRAAEEIDKAVELDSRDVKTLVLAGQIHWTLGNSEKAEQYLKKAVSIDPDASDATVSLAGALTPKSPQQAIKLYKDFLVRHPNEVEIQERLAQLYQTTGDNAKAKDAWEKTLEWEPSSVRAHLALAQIAEVEYDTSTAISHYEGVLTQDPSNLPLLLRIGELRYRSNDMAKASDAFSRAQTIAPTSAAANFWLALLSENRGDWKEAIRFLKQIPMKTSDPGLLLRLSYYYSQDGQFKEATRTLEKLSKSDPTNTDFLSYLAVSYEQDGQDGAAEKTLRKLIEVDPNDAEAHFHLAGLLDRMGKFEKAEAELKTAIKLKPDYDVALNYLGYSYAERAIHLDEAEQLVAAAISLDPDNAAYFDSLGWVHYKQGKYQKAENMLREASKRSRDPLIWEHLGDVLEAKGEFQEAVLVWDASLQADPKSKKVPGKIEKALKRLSKSDRLNVFIKRGVNNFGDMDTVRGFISVSVCEAGPCFDTKAKFDYAGGDLRVEIPGPLSGPVMLLTKKRGKPAKYGAIHPVFQTVEAPVTRAFDRIESLLSSDVFHLVDLSELAASAVEKAGALEAESKGIRFRLDAKNGRVIEILWKMPEGDESLKLSTYDTVETPSLPRTIEWNDLAHKFTIRINFQNPVITTDVPSAKR